MSSVWTCPACGAVSGGAALVCNRCGTPRDLDFEPIEPEAPEGFASPLPFAVYLRDVVEGLLQKNGWRYQINDDGDFELELKGDSGRLTYTIGYDDTEQELMVQAASGREISPDDSNKALLTCNRWNEQNWLPKVYTEAAGGDSETEYKRFRAEMTLPLGSAVSQALVDEFTRTAVESCRRFWDWLVQEEPSLELV
jgi:hypothetical protein